MQHPQKVSLPEEAVGVERRGVTGRSIAIGLAVALFIQGWGIYSRRLIRSSGMTAGFLSPALFVAMLIILFLLNPVLKRVGRPGGLSLREMLTIFAMGLVGGAPIAHVFAFITIPYYLATPENQWGTLLHPSLPSWIAPLDVDGAGDTAVQRAGRGAGRDSMGSVGGADVLVGAAVLCAGFCSGFAFGGAAEAVGGARAAAVSCDRAYRGDGQGVGFEQMVASVRTGKAVLDWGLHRVCVYFLERAALDFSRVSRDAGSGTGLRVFRAGYAADVQLYRSVYVCVFLFRQPGRAVQRLVLLRGIRAGVRGFQPAGLQHRRQRRPVRVLRCGVELAGVGGVLRVRAFRAVDGQAAPERCGDEGVAVGASGGRFIRDAVVSDGGCGDCAGRGVCGCVAESSGDGFEDGGSAGGDAVCIVYRCGPDHCGVGSAVCAGSDDGTEFFGGTSWAPKRCRLQV